MSRSSRFAPLRAAGLGACLLLATACGPGVPAPAPSPSSPRQGSSTQAESTAWKVWRHPIDLYSIAIPDSWLVETFQGPSPTPGWLAHPPGRPEVRVVIVSWGIGQRQGAAEVDQQEQSWSLPALGVLSSVLIEERVQTAPGRETRERQRVAVLRGQPGEWRYDATFVLARRQCHAAVLLCPEDQADQWSPLYQKMARSLTWTDPEGGDASARGAAQESANGNEESLWELPGSTGSPPRQAAPGAWTMLKHEYYQYRFKVPGDWCQGIPDELNRSRARVVSPPDRPEVRVVAFPFGIYDLPAAEEVEKSDRNWLLSSPRIVSVSLLEKKRLTVGTREATQTRRRFVLRGKPAVWQAVATYVEARPKCFALVLLCPESEAQRYLPIYQSMVSTFVAYDPAQNHRKPQPRPPGLNRGQPTSGNGSPAPSGQPGPPRPPAR